MTPDDVITYRDVVNPERAALQKGMNFGTGENYFVFRMLVRAVGVSDGCASKSASIWANARNALAYDSTCCPERVLPFRSSTI